jgi:hypothetical protein
MLKRKILTNVTIYYINLILKEYKHWLILLVYVGLFLFIILIDRFVPYLCFSRGSVCFSSIDCYEQFSSGLYCPVKGWG